MSKVRYWRETTETEFYELWPETDRNRLDAVVISGTERVLTYDQLEAGLYGDEDDDE